jgi:hypothetical protein
MLEDPSPRDHVESDAAEAAAEPNMTEARVVTLGPPDVGQQAEVAVAVNKIISDP